MPTHQRKLIKNHFVLEFIPFGRNFNEFMVPFVSEIKKFEKGKIMTVQGQDAWVIAGLGLVTADLPQGCRTCTTKKESLSTYNQDSVTTLHYHHITDEEISKISQESVISKRGQLYTEYGLRSSPSILDKAPNGSGLNREPIRNRQKIRFGSQFGFGLGTVRFGLVLSEIKKKCEKTNIRLSSDRTRTSHSSLESSHRDASNGGKIMSLASIDHEIAHGECFLKNLH
ncbi:hypothetical protein RirG_128500 [Rhizophagus irregularis DAOM 197198w]|uniref:Uncharacterized protein n=1 Tax=Rhizophagus irregularis (strain DAOM 197198w) TaxID=1432141 RepID=A0A015MGG7_RHIIW|nr:hypothetical protein RirG_128500 [Rhizophagus irregularis DAOM 197198w]